MKCRHGHRWLGDRCVIGWCRQDVEAVDRVDGESFWWFTEPEFNRSWEAERSRMMQALREATNNEFFRR